MSPPRALRAAVLFASLGVSSVGCGPRASNNGGAGQGESSGDEARSERAPVEMTLLRARGGPLDLASLRGKALVVVAFLMDDLASQVLLRRAETLARAHPDDLAVLVLSGDRHPPPRHRELVSVYADVLELRSATPVLADDAVRDGATVFGVIEHVPVTYLFNRAGVLARRVDGQLSQGELEALVAPALPPRMTPAATTAAPR